MNGNKVATACLVIIVVFLFGLLLKEAKPVFFPFFLAVMLYFLMSPALDFLTRLKIPKAVSILFLVIITFFIFYLLGALFYSSGKSFAAELPKYGQRLQSIIDSIQMKLQMPQIEWETLDWTKQFDLGKVGGFVLSSLGPFFSFMANLFLVFIFLIFILSGRGKVKNKVVNYYPKEKSERFITMAQNIDSQIQRYIAIKTLVSFLTGVFAGIVLVIWGLDFAIVFAFLTFILNYIPNIGSFIATVFPVAIAIFQYDTIWPAIWICVILITLQQVMGNFVEPRLMGKGLGLSPLVVLFSLFFWGWLWGIPGMILATPMTAIVKIVCSNIPELRVVAVLMSKD
jgi:predicted PurR-regulated permease PerM